jgi:hypothetical protein
MQADRDESKLKSVSCLTFRDGRIQFSFSAAASLSPQKAGALAVCLLVVLVYLFAPIQGLRNRVLDLEDRLNQKISGFMQHRQHIRTHLGGGGGKVATGADVAPHEDGRRHLWVPPGGISRLAESLAPRTALADFDDGSYLCGSGEGVTEGGMIQRTLALAAVSYRAPLSLGNAMASWADGGLLDIIDERMLFLNAPTEEDREIGRRFDFDIYETDERGGNVMAGPAIAYLVGNSTADYILFMEKDFVLSAGREAMEREIYVGLQHLERGVDVYRLRGTTDFPAEGMPDCCAAADPTNCPYHSNWRSAGNFGDSMNWLLIFCDKDIMENSRGRLAHCEYSSDCAHGASLIESG